MHVQTEAGLGGGLVVQLQVWLGLAWVAGAVITGCLCLNRCQLRTRAANAPSVFTITVESSYYRFHILNMVRRYKIGIPTQISK